MFCDKCGNQLRNGAQFCTKCGMAVKTNTEEDNSEYTPLTPNFDNVDDNKPLHERIEDIDKPLFSDETDKFNNPQPNKKNQKKKKTWLLYIVIPLLVFLIPIMIVILSNLSDLKIEWWPLSYEKAYAKVCDEYLERVENRVSDETGKNVAIVDLGGSAMPDMVYFDSYGNLSTCVSHYDEETGKGYCDFSGDSWQGYDDDSLTLFYSSCSENILYYYSGYDSDEAYEQKLSRFVYGLDNDLQFEVLATSKSHDGGISEYYINEDPVSQEEYEEFMLSYFTGETTIILSTEDNLSLFTNIVDDISMTRDDAVEFLKEKKTPSSIEHKENSGDISSNNNETTMVEVTEEPTESPKANDFIKIYTADTYYNKIRDDDVSYAMPLLNIYSSDADTINDELISVYEDALESIKALKADDPYNADTYAVNYKVWLNDNILSLCIERDFGISSGYLFYNIDILSGKRIGNEAIAEHYETTFNEMFENVRSAVNSAFAEKFRQLDSAELEKFRPQTTSDDNINQSVLFIGDNNQLYVMYEWFMSVQAGYGQDIGEVNI